MLPLAGGTSMPQLGLGVWQMSDTEAEAAAGAAIDVGYRLVDTAAAYGNEEGAAGRERRPRRRVRHHEAVDRRARTPSAGTRSSTGTAHRPPGGPTLPVDPSFRQT